MTRSNLNIGLMMPAFKRNNRTRSLCLGGQPLILRLIRARTLPCISEQDPIIKILSADTSPLYFPMTKVHGGNFSQSWGFLSLIMWSQSSTTPWHPP